MSASGSSESMDAKFADASDTLEVSELKSEIDSLNGLLTESANALYELSLKFHAERELNSTLVEELEETRNEVETLTAENDILKLEIQRLKSASKRNILYPAEDESSSSSEAPEAPFEDYLALKLKAAQAEITSLLKTHTEVLCDGMIEAETDLMELLARFPGVDFEKKEPEPDPYSSTKGWAGRRPRPQVDGVDPDSPSSTSAHTGTDPTAVGYMYGSPSERFPLSDRSTISELDEEGSENDDEAVSTGSGSVTGDDDEASVEIKVDLDSVNEWSSAENILHDDNN